MIPLNAGVAMLARWVTAPTVVVPTVALITLKLAVVFVHHVHVFRNRDQGGRIPAARQILSRAAG